MTYLYSILASGFNSFSHSLRKVKSQEMPSGRPAAFPVFQYLLAGIFMLANFASFSQGSFIEPPCQDLRVLSAQAADVSDCGERDGKIRLSIEDESRRGSASYQILLGHGEKGEVDHGVFRGDDIEVGGLAPGAYGPVTLVRQSDGCRLTVPAESLIVGHSCDDEDFRQLAGSTGAGAADRLTGCGTGTVNYTNCDGNTVSINLSNLSPSTYIVTAYYNVTCIAYVDSDCNIGPSSRAFCADIGGSYPAHPSGYGLGQVHFTETDYIGAGVSELQAERINWIFCNAYSQGYSESNINQAIWGVLNQTTCNTLCNNAKNAVPSVVGGIASQMTFYLPDISNAQPLIKKDCVCGHVDDIVLNDLNGGADVVLQDGGVYNVSSLPSSFNLEALVSGGIESVRFTISGDYTGTNIENTYPYEHPASSGGAWNIGPGTYTINIKAYTADNAQGVLCYETTLTITIVDTPPPTGCNFTANAGPDQTICPGSSATLTAMPVTSGDCNRYALAVAHYTGYVSDPAAAIGPPDGNGAYFHAQNTNTYTRAVWDMGNTISAGSTVCIRVRRSGSWGSSDLQVYCAADGINPATSAFTLVGNYSFSNSSYQDLCFQVPVNCRYIKVRDNYGKPFYVDAVYVDCSSCTYSYLWSNGATTESITVNPVTTTTYSVTISDCGSCSSTDEVVVNVPGPPVVSAGPDVTICKGTSTTLTATATGGGGNYTFQWSNGLGAGASHTVSPTVTTTYTVTVTDGNGCTNTDQVKVTVN